MEWKKESLSPENYNEYHYGILEWLLYACMGGCTAALAVWIFYKNIVITVFAFLIGLLYPFYKKNVLIEKRRNVLRLQFKDLLYYLGSLLSAGKSVEQAFIQLYTVLRSLYQGDGADIVKETGLIIRRLQMNENIEVILKDLANRSGIEEVHHFADVFQVCKRSGGNLVEVVRTTTRMISERIEIKQEIDTGLSGKKQEQRILSVSPVAMILLISFMSGEFMDPLFTTAAGRAVMTLSLLMIGTGIYMSHRIMNIKF